MGERSFDMLSEIKERVCLANLRLKDEGLISLTWGNASAFVRESGLVIIKPSGVSYQRLKPEDMVVVDLSGKVVEGSYRPSSDTPTHIELYKSLDGVCGIVHTHSTMATAWAQAVRSLPCYGTTHADSFMGSIPVTRWLTEEEVSADYEANTGHAIVEAINVGNPLECPGVLVAGHGPFTWGKDVESALEASVALERIAHMAYVTEQLCRRTESGAAKLPAHIADKHFDRKHGTNAYYGQV